VCPQCAPAASQESKLRRQETMLSIGYLSLTFGFMGWWTKPSPVRTGSSVGYAKWSICVGSLEAA